MPNLPLVARRIAVAFLFLLAVATPALGDDIAKKAAVDAHISDLQGALDVLDDAGCRAIPYLVGALDPGKYTTFLTLATTHLAAAATASDDPIIRLQREYEQRQEWRIEKQDPPAERQRKCDLLRAWWAKDGGRYHQAWRVWSSSCAR